VELALDIADRACVLDQDAAVDHDAAIKERFCTV
jgi:hypothetical protein